VCLLKIVKLRLHNVKLMSEDKVGLFETQYSNVSLFKLLNYRQLLRIDDLDLVRTASKCLFLASHCPKKANRNIKLTQSDLMLCIHMKPVIFHLRRPQRQRPPPRHESQSHRQKADNTLSVLVLKILLTKLPARTIKTYTKSANSIYIKENYTVCVSVSPVLR